MARIFVLGHGVKIKKNIFSSNPRRLSTLKVSERPVGFVWLICHMIPLGVELEFFWTRIDSVPQRALYHLSYTPTTLCTGEKKVNNTGSFLLLHFFLIRTKSSAQPESDQRPRDINCKQLQSWDVVSSN